MRCESLFSMHVRRLGLLVCLITVLTGFANLSAPAQGSCSNVNVASDRMGFRFVDPGGNWRYMTPGSAQAVTLVRFSNLSYYGIRVQAEEAKRLFGDCRAAYETVLSAFVPIFVPGKGDRPETGSRTPIFHARSDINMSFFGDVRKHDAYLYTANGADLVVIGKRYYAASDDGAVVCELALCTVDDLGKLSGIVSDAARWAAGKSAKKIRSLVPTFDKAKLKIDLEIEGTAGRETGSFSEAAILP